MLHSTISQLLLTLLHRRNCYWALLMKMYILTVCRCISDGFCLARAADCACASCMYICICTYVYTYHSSAAQDDGVVLVRTEPSDQSPCPGQTGEYECHSEIPVSTLVWTLPTGESLPDFTGGSMNGSRRTASDGVYVATLTSLVPDDDPNSDFFFFTSTLLIMETVKLITPTSPVLFLLEMM